MLTKELNWSHFSHCPRFWRRKVHLVWGPPVASAMLHLLPVLRLTGGRRLFPYRGQDLVPWMQQQPLHAIEKLLIMYSAFALTKLLLSTTKVKKPRSLLRKKTQLNKCHHSKGVIMTDQFVSVYIRYPYRNYCHVQRSSLHHLKLYV